MKAKFKGKRLNILMIIAILGWGEVIFSIDVAGNYYSATGWVIAAFGIIITALAIALAIPKRIPDLYYIRTTGYSGNSLMWWREGSKGYTTDLKQAGLYSKEEAEGICRSRNTDVAYKVSTVMAKGTFQTVHADYLKYDDADINFRD